MITGMAAAAGETIHFETDKDIDGVTSTEPTRQTLLDTLTGNLLAVTTGSSGPYTPGETINFDSEVNVESESVRDGDAVLVTEFYRCQDSGCDDGSSDEFLGAERRFIDFGTDSYLGGDWSHSLEWTAPSQEGYYAAVAYMYDTKDGEIASDKPRKVFQVTTSTDDGTTTEPVEPPQIEQTQNPDVKVIQSQDTVIGTVYFENTGGEMTSSQSNIVEMQVRDNQLSFLSTISREKLCDESVTTNVHKEYPDTGETIGSGEDFNIALSVDNLEPGTKHVYFMTRSQCANADGSQERVNPYKYSKYAGTVTIESEDTDTGGTGNEGTGEGGEEDKDIPVEMILIGAGIIALAGGAYLYG